MRSSSTGSLSTASVVGTSASDSPCAAACGANSAASRANSGCSGTVGALRRERAGVEPRQVEQLREQPFERVDGGVDARHQRLQFRLARLRGQRRGEEAHRVQRLAQIVARGGEELALRAVRGLGRRCASSAALRLRLQLADQVDVFVAHRERMRQHVVEVVPEAEHEREHHAHHDRRERRARCRPRARRARSAAPARAARSRRTTACRRR